MPGDEDFNDHRCKLLAQGRNRTLHYAVNFSRWTNLTEMRRIEWKKC